MQKITCFLILLMAFSCNEKKIESEKKPDNKEFNDEELQKIGHFYQPEQMTTRPIKMYINSEKKNYEIDIYNSDVLKKDKENLKSNSDKIAILLKRHLTKNNVVYNDIIVRIYQKNNEKKSFQYSNKDLIEIESKRRLDQKK
ncbi:hypothetical protein Q1W71_15325 [Flavobacterium pectinovorum]|uniref:hypothetical protein n=1 Tax=Flavobacterium pectinovorum TaxID=29533 RepID=UPI00265F4A3A|nr:hypothetical protein [Flavobacterium pectinovorum]WKL46324.1 hypothetical protein Q1W71_15325 [Flavobacterium pectinovorum]